MHILHEKKWSHYLWEFFMLFLAVFCGFLAENFREHSVEHGRAKVFARSLIEDLQADTAEIHLNKLTIERYFRSAALALAELRKPRALQNDTILQLNGVYNLFDLNYFDPQMGTYEEIKNSGALRYFRTSIANKLTDYETDANRLRFQKEDYLSFHRSTLSPFIINMLNADFVNAIHEKKPFNGPSAFITEPDARDINTWKNVILIAKKRQEIEYEGVKGHEKRALDLIRELREVYHLKK